MILIKYHSLFVNFEIVVRGALWVNLYPSSSKYIFSIRVENSVFPE